MVVAPAVDIERMVAPKAQGSASGISNTAETSSGWRGSADPGNNAHYRRHLKAGDAVHRRQDADHLDRLRRIATSS